MREGCLPSSARRRRTTAAQAGFSHNEHNRSCAPSLPRCTALRLPHMAHRGLHCRVRARECVTLPLYLALSFGSLSVCNVALSCCLLVADRRPFERVIKLAARRGLSATAARTKRTLSDVPNERFAASACRPMAAGREKDVAVFVAVVSVVTALHQQLLWRQ